MASVLSHPAVALGLGPLLEPLGVPPRVWAVGAACTVLPDVDILGFSVGIRYGDVLGHRGLTHSLAFAALLAAGLAAIFFRSPGAGIAPAAVFVYLFLCTASHGLFDAMTDGGLGVGFFLPFRDERTFLPFRPIHVSPIGVDGFFGRRGLQILASELKWIWTPSLLAGGAGLLLRRVS